MFGIGKAHHRVGGTTAPAVIASMSECGWIKRDEAIMGTAISVELWSDDASEGRAAIGAVMAEMHRIDRTMSPHKPDSELSIINRDAFAGPVRLSAEMAALLVRANEFSEMSGGALIQVPIPTTTRRSRARTPASKQPQIGRAHV